MSAISAINQCRKFREKINLEYEYYQRYRELKKTYPKNRNFPSFFDFDTKTLPYKDKDGEMIYEKALSLKRSYCQKLWKEKSKIITPQERQNFQIVTISPRNSLERDNNGKYFTNPDFSNKLYEELQVDQLGPNPIARFVRGEPYKGTDKERDGKVEGLKKVSSVFIVASPIDEIDTLEIIRVASEYRMQGAKEVILIAPNMLDEREDKNVGKDPDGKLYPNHRTIKINALMSALSGSIDRIATYEAHSSATQAFAALNGIALAPISNEEELIGAIKNEIIEKDEWALVRPDAGRNLVATRAEKTLHVKGVHLGQTRDSKSGEKKLDGSGILSEAEKKALKNKNVIIYDDEAGTFNTMKNVIDYILPADLKSINILLAHARLQKGWEKNLKDIIKKSQEKGVKIRILVTDSRIPIGDLQKFIKENPEVELVSINRKNKTVIRAIVDNIDLYSCNNYRENDGQVTDFERSILNFISGFDDDGKNSKDD